MTDKPSAEAMEQAELLVLRYCASYARRKQEIALALDAFAARRVAKERERSRSLIIWSSKTGQWYGDQS